MGQLGQGVQAGFVIQGFGGGTVQALASGGQRGGLPHICIFRPLFVKGAVRGGKGVHCCASADSLSFKVLKVALRRTGVKPDSRIRCSSSAMVMAAVAVAGSIWAPVALLGIGCLLALPPLSAQLVGSGRPDRAAHLLRQGLWLTLGLSLVLVSFFYAISFRLHIFGLEPALADLAGGYLRAIMRIPGEWLVSPATERRAKFVWLHHTPRNGLAQESSRGKFGHIAWQRCYTIW